MADPSAGIGHGRVMDEPRTPDIRSISTPWAWRRVKIGPAPQANSDRERSEASQGSLTAWPRRRPVTLTLTYRGGPEAFWQIEARGRTWRRPGVIALHDLMVEVMAWQGGIPRSSSASTRKG